MADKSISEIEAEIKRIQLETAQIELEEAREKNSAFRAAKELRSRQNRQRMAQLRADLTERVAVISSCTHRQGGSPGRERKGSGPSALRVVILPDSRTLVMCANCPLRVFSPLPADQNPKPREGETVSEAKARVRRYHQEVEEFAALEEVASDQLTPEAGAPMHCGKTFQFVGRDGNQVSMPAPCDSYAQGRDNRNVL